ncbi:transposase [Leptospira weilii]|uniref:transposase n=1 Tax=Leptospira weilii TaxID=28184 RepID=UPI0005654616|nr:transposase [Leptospira weilii]
MEQYEELTMTTAERLISEGIQQGIEKGIEQEKLETAGKMLQKGIDLKTILEITGLTEQDLRDSDIMVRAGKTLWPQL